MGLLFSSTVLFLASSIVSLVTASPLSSRSQNLPKQWTFSEILPSKHLTWYPCFSNFTCAMLDVPLDYTNPNLGRSYVPIIRYAATTTPYKGMVLSNPGGPGGSGVAFLQEVIDLELQVVGSNYDLVSWDPRGIGASIPAANCTLPSNLQKRSLEPLSGPELAPIFFEASYNQSVEIGVACQNSIGGPTQAGPHVTTAIVVRDVISIVDAHAASEQGRSCENASLLNYWGFSYGTVIGQTFASMFPNRLGRVILDGVVNPDDWIKGTAQNFVTNTDEVFSTFFVYCNAAGPVNCPYYTGTTAHDIYLRFEAFVNSLSPISAYQNGWSNATAIEYFLTGIKLLIFGEIYSPINGFPLIAQALVAAESLLPDVTLAKLQQLEQELGVNLTAPPDVSSLWERAVLCTDTGGIEYGLTLPEVLTRLPKAESESWLAGEYILTQGISCAGWPITSNYRYPGPFYAKTNNPILFVSNTLDMITPHQNGVNGTTRFSGSQLLTIEGIGHTSSATQNLCAFGKLNIFFQTGKLPGKDNYCPLEAGPWNVTLPGPLSQLSDKRDIKEKFRGLLA
ncbi:uncharacterized protein PAC_05962 [Phialocephala subalpina]|uniref:Peptidase S33 tripeptidyl aminopeptidase-like C-terminal domain-containing protein n=1 Tax=Phialocephala subalpina TaxID=576137 RepID=A0A1L7WTG7_9HELO|nr:uncharacterized protein PAC_05962 [Phialocephala subalpina]